MVSKANVDESLTALACTDLSIPSSFVLYLAATIQLIAKQTFAM
jgi:hypothetical protein